MRNKIIKSVFIGILLFGCIRKECEPVPAENTNGVTINNPPARLYTAVIQARSAIQDSYVVGNPANQNKFFDDQPVIYTSAWTYNGDFVDINGFIKFTYPERITKDNIKGAKLTLYADTTKKWYILPDTKLDTGHYIGDTSIRLVLKKVSEPWSAQSITYNNQPAISDKNEILVKLTEDISQSYSFNVTEIVKEQLETSNNGFFLGLSKYTFYTRVCFYSTMGKYPSLYPKLEIEYLE